MEWVVSIIVLALVLGAIALLGTFAWRFRVTTNRGKFLWLSGAWAFVCWFLTGNLVFVWPLFVALSVGFAAYALYTFSGTLTHRAILSFTIVLPGTVSVALLSPPWPEGWAGFKPVFVFGPAVIVLVVVVLWFVAQRYVLPVLKVNRPTTGSRGTSALTRRRP